MDRSRNSDEKGRTAMVLLSGGLDSAVCLFWAKAHFDSVYAISFNYHGRLHREKIAAEKLSLRAGVKKLLTVDLPFLRETSDFDGFGIIDKIPSLDGDSRLNSYIPARNMIFYSIAAYHAEYLGVSTIIGGHNLHDSAFFRDSSTQYFDKLNELFNESCLLCNEQHYKVILPLSQMNRKMIIELAQQLEVPVELTWSCHENGKMPCGTCYACVQRAEAFEHLQISDPSLKPQENQVS